MSGQTFIPWSCWMARIKVTIPGTEDILWDSITVARAGAREDLGKISREVLARAAMLD